MSILIYDTSHSVAPVRRKVRNKLKKFAAFFAIFLACGRDSDLAPVMKNDVLVETRF